MLRCATENYCGCNGSPPRPRHLTTAPVDCLRAMPPTGSFHCPYQRLQRIQCWPAAAVDAVVRVRRIDVDQHRPAGHWRAVEQIGTHAIIDDDRREKDFGLCRLRARRGDERERLSGAIRCICRRRSRTAAAQRLVIPAAARTVPVDRLRGPSRARLLLGHTFWQRLNVGRYERKRDHYRRGSPQHGRGL
jgi:hypothetical protein